MVAQPNRGENVLGVYSAAELARVVDVSPGLVRRYALAGILGEGGDRRFGFTDVVLLRAIKSLREARISSPRIRRALAGLRKQLPAGVPASAASIAAEGGRIVARYGDDAWDLESGQRVLDLVPARAEAPATDLAAPAIDGGVPDIAPAQRVEEWFALALEVEDEDAEQATTLYRRILTLDRDHPDAHLNLGRLLHERGDLYLAERHYRRAIAVRDDDPTAWFNLGVVLEDRNRPQPAVEAYEHAIQLDDTHADAFYNLGNLYQGLGAAADAVRCLNRYRRLTRD